MKKFSIITVVLNNENHIESTIKSVISQSFNNFEYIIIDGNSTDNTKNIINKYVDKIDIFISEQDNGLFDAMNKGVNISSGEYILFLNSGDLFFSSETLSNISKHINNEDFIFGDYYKYKTSIKNAFFIDSKNISDLHHIPYSHQALFTKRNCLIEYPFNLNYKLAADYDHYMFWKNKGFKLKYIQHPICYFQLGGISQKQRKKGILENFEIAFKYNSSKKIFLLLLYKKFRRLLRFYLFKGA